MSPVHKGHSWEQEEGWDFRMQLCLSGTRVSLSPLNFSPGGGLGCHWARSVDQAFLACLLVSASATLS